jgi:hypothetical protein
VFAMRIKAGVEPLELSEAVRQGEASFTPKERNLCVVCRDADNQVHRVGRHDTSLVRTTLKDGARPTDRHYSDEYKSAITQ